MNARPDLVARRKPNTATPVQFNALKHHAVAVGKRMPTDEQVAGAAALLRALPRSCLTPVAQPDEKKAQEELLRDIQRNNGPAVQRNRSRG